MTEPIAITEEMVRAVDTAFSFALDAMVQTMNSIPASQVFIPALLELGWKIEALPKPEPPKIWVHACIATKDCDVCGQRGVPQ